MVKDVVFIVGPGNLVLGHSELRYALRSLQHFEHGEVWMVGIIPPWVTGVNSIPVHREPGKYAKWKHAKLNLHAIVDSEFTPDEFWLWHDDMMLTQTVDEPPMFNVGTIDEHAGRIESQYPGSGYVTALRATRDILRGEGVETPISYEAHTPFLHTKAGLRRALDLCRWCPRLHERSIDGNLRGLDLPRAEDVKIYDADGPEILPSLVSFSDQSWMQKAGSRIRQMLKDPSPYEKRRAR